MNDEGAPQPQIGPLSYSEAASASPAWRPLFLAIYLGTNFLSRAKTPGIATSQRLGLGSSA